MSSTLEEPQENYFYMRCSEAELEQAQQDNVWPTNPVYHESLQKAYSECGDVFIVFTLHLSRCFSGVAKMASAITWPVERTIFDRSKYRQQTQLEWVSKSCVQFDEIKNQLDVRPYDLIRRHGEKLNSHIGRFLRRLLAQENLTVPLINCVESTFQSSIEWEDGKRQQELEHDMERFDVNDRQQEIADEAVVKQGRENMEIDDLQKEGTGDLQDMDVEMDIDIPDREDQGRILEVSGTLRRDESSPARKINL
ncbi:hypothetical protein EDD11_001373 [Mortierella claussenii]|nr:hypothetical protein EDD11_001373 [Mortierella claussenii]